MGEIIFWIFGAPIIFGTIGSLIIMALAGPFWLFSEWKKRDIEKKAVELELYKLKHGIPLKEDGDED